MKVMVVGGGGREHTIIKKIKENKNVSEIFALPGNGGMKDDAVCTGIDAKKIDRIVEFYHSYGAKVMIEGIETAEEYEYIKHTPIDFAQGNYLGKPI